VIAVADNDAATDTDPILTVTDAAVTFDVRGENRRRRETIRALDGVSLTVRAGESLGIVGESGSGKTTLARAIVGLQPLTEGTIAVAGVQGERTRRRGDLQMVFQDPYSSLDPHQRVRHIIGESILAAGLVPKRDVRARVESILDLVGLRRDLSDRRASELSGGQRQRVGIGRALASEPRLIVCDEPVTALDVSVQAQIVNLLIDLRRRLGLTFVFISHDVAVVEQVADRVAVMYLGRVVESGPVEEVFGRPTHPYTAALVSAVPSLDPQHALERPRIVLAGEPPSPVNPPSGCRFHPRCWLRDELEQPDACANEDPPLTAVAQDGEQCAACHFSARTQPALLSKQRVAR
jgi:oligopeptide/dipeptide ABC transporter ATP-binding protein